MSRQSANTRWAMQVSKVVEEQFQIKSAIEHKKHVHVVFFDGDVRWMWVIPSTPSDSRRGTVNNLSSLRKGLLKTWGSERIRWKSLASGHFPIEFTPPFVEERLEQDLEREWDEFFDGLSKMPAA